METLGAAILVVVATLSPAFRVEDASIFFNHANNLQSPKLAYFYQGYIIFYPAVTAYVVHFLPFEIQLILYKFVPLIVLWILYRELKKLFLLYCSELEATVISLACIFCFGFIEKWALAVLAYSIWAALFAAMAYSVRLQLSGANYSVLGAIGLLAVALSHPGGVLIIPILLYGTTGKTDWTKKAANCFLSLILAALYFLSRLRPSIRSYLNFRASMPFC